MIEYNYKDIELIYEKLGVGNTNVVFWTGNFAVFGQLNLAKKTVLDMHFKAITTLLGEEGTLVVPTASMTLCNTDIPFDIEKTPSETGVFTEYVRNVGGACRSFHPFVSYTAIGKHAEDICGDVAHHAFGPETPEARMIDFSALSISVGLHPRLTCSLVHHVEMMMGVPYRYTKEFMHPVVRDEKIVKEPFYQYVWYRDCNMKRDNDRKIFKHFCANHNIEEVKVNRGNVYSYSMADLYKSTVKLFKNDIYAYLTEPPKVKPYQQ